MDEARFRALMHEAVGEEPMQPWLADGVRRRLVVQVGRSMRNRVALLVAAALSVLAVAGLVLPQLLAHRSTLVTPASTASPVPVLTPKPAPVDPFNCRLPIAIGLFGPDGSRVGSEVGFVDTNTGQYTIDRSASVADLPHGFSTTPTLYSPVPRRWLPISSLEIAPDRRSYAWILLLPDASTPKTAELHVYDVVKATDHTLWTHAGAIYIWRWDAAGILAADRPPTGFRAGVTSWLVDPLTGAATQEVPPASFFVFTPLPGDPHGTDGTGFHSIGVDADGHLIWWFFNLDKPGAVDWVFYETTPGQRVYVYRGTQGDATSFDPLEAMADSTGIWFSDHNYLPVIWHWQLGKTLRKVAVVGLPGPPAGANSYVLVSPAGPCF